MTFDIIIDVLAKGEKIELRNFGVFKTKSRKGRMGRNPRTGQQVPVKAKRVAVFKPGGTVYILNEDSSEVCTADYMVIGTA